MIGLVFSVVEIVEDNGTEERLELLPKTVDVRACAAGKAAGHASECHVGAGVDDRVTCESIARA